MTSSSRSRFLAVFLLPLSTLFTAPVLAQEQPAAVVTYAPDTTDFPNPERGFHDGVDLVNAADLTWVAEGGYTLARSYIRLDDYRDRPLSDTLLQRIERGFDAARAAGIKIIPRFSYNFGIGEPDAPLEQVLEHIGQLQSVLETHADVIAVLQAGFIGAWGEWHSSTNGLDTPENRAAILNALLDALPAERMVQLRYPADLIELFPEPLPMAEAFTGTDRARVGHKNDCFLANEHDAGTYMPLERKDAFQTYLEAMTPYTAVGGETCQVTPEQHRTDCPTALAELERFHWDYLNDDFFAGAIERWKTEGCYDTIRRSLGYRYRLTESSGAAVATAGQLYELTLTLRNDGWGGLYNTRPLELILRHQSTGTTHRLTADLGEDLRTWLPGPQETRTRDLAVLLPGDLEAGPYDLLLYAPDAAATLAGTPAYSIRLANTDVWEAETGYNDLQRTLNIAEATDGALEVGVTHIAQPSRDAWTRVTLTGAFSAPIVIAGPPSLNGGEPVTVRVRDVSPQGFDIQIHEYDYLNGGHVEEDAAYLVLDRGRFLLPDGSPAEAGMLEASTAWSSIRFTQTFLEPPIVLAQVTSLNDPRAVVTRLRNVGPGGFGLQLQGAEIFDQDHGPEQVHWVAFAAASSGGDGLAYETGRTDTVVTHIPYAVALTEPFADPPAVLAAMQTVQGPNTANLRLIERAASGFQVRVYEEQSADEEVWHFPEAVGYGVFEPGAMILSRMAPASGPVSTTAGELPGPPGEHEAATRLERAYPNPFNPATRLPYVIQTASDVRLEIFDALGRRVALLAEGLHQPGRHEATFDAASLPSGLYLARLQAGPAVFTQHLMLVK